MKNWFLLAILVASTHAFCSFDLFLMPTSNGRVTRFDPINRVALGQFGPNTPGQVFNSPTGVWVQNSSGRYARYNYSTGELLNQSSVLPNFTSNAITGSTVNHLTGIVGNTLREFQMVTGTSSTIGSLNSSFIYSQVERLPNGTYVVMGKNSQTSNYVVETYTGSGNLIDSVQVISNTIQGAVGQMAITQSGLSYRVHAFVGAGGGAPAATLMTSTITATGLISSTSSIGVGAYSWTLGAEPATVVGHDGLWVVGPKGGAASTTIRISQLSLSPNVSVIDQYDVDFVLPNSGRWSMVNVVAPEPASLFGLSVPLALLFKRRVQK